MDHAPHPSKRYRSQCLAHGVAYPNPATKRETKTLTFGAKGFVLASAMIDCEEMIFVRSERVGQREFSIARYRIGQIIAARTPDTVSPPVHDHVVFSGPAAFGFSTRLWLSSCSGSLPFSFSSVSLLPTSSRWPLRKRSASLRIYTSMIRYRTFVPAPLFDKLTGCFPDDSYVPGGRRRSPGHRFLGEHFLFPNPPRAS